MSALKYVTEMTIDKYLDGLMNTAGVAPHCKCQVLELLGLLDLLTCEFEESVTEDGDVVRVEEYTSTESLKALMDKRGKLKRLDDEDGKDSNDEEPDPTLH